MTRVVAVVAAAALVLGAIFARRALDDGGSDGTDGAGGVPTVVCATEVAAACERLEADDLVDVVVTEPAGVTSDRLLSPGEDLGAAGWVVAGPWPEIVGDLDVSAPLATGSASVFVRPNREAALAGRCDPPDWVCLEAIADRPWTELGGPPTWGEVRLGVPSIDTTAGLVTASVAVADQLGRADYATNDLVDETADFLGRLARADTTPPGGLSPLASLVRRPGSLDVAAGLSPEVQGLPAGRVVEVSDPARATVTVVLAGDPAAFDLTAVAEALTATGWSAAPAGAPRSTGLPEPDVMEGVRTSWTAVGG